MSRVARRKLEAVHAAKSPKDLRLPGNHLEDVLKPPDITADTALRLARYLGTSPDFWMNMQSHYDLRVAEQHKLADIKRAVRPRREAA